MSAERESLELRLTALGAAEPGAPEWLVASTLRRTRGELAAGYGRGEMARELLRLLAATSPSLLLAALWTWSVVALGGALLAPLLPAALVHALLAAYVFGALGWTALVAAAAPALVHHKLARRHREALP